MCGRPHKGGWAATLSSESRLGHGWVLVRRPGLGRELIHEFIRPAVRALPRAMAVRLGSCRIALPERLEDKTGRDVASRWAETSRGLEVEVATEGVGSHDVAIELLLCLGQALWERTVMGEREAYWKLLDAEIEAGATGEINVEALREKRALLGGRISARSLRRLERYGRASFAATAAEYVHSLWHDVQVRTGPQYLPAKWLLRRLETFLRWYPPNRGFRLFARRVTRQSSP